MKSSTLAHMRVVFTTPSCGLVWKMDNTTGSSSDPTLDQNCLLCESTQKCPPKSAVFLLLELHLPSGRVWSQVTCLFSVAAGLQHWAGSCRSECRPACERAQRTGYHPPPAPASSLQPSSYGHAMLWNTYTYTVYYT